MADDFDADRLLIHLDLAEENQLLEPATIAAFRELVEGEAWRRRALASADAQAVSGGLFGATMQISGEEFRVVGFQFRAGRRIRPDVTLELVIDSAAPRPRRGPSPASVR